MYVKLASPVSNEQNKPNFISVGHSVIKPEVFKVQTKNGA